MSSAAGLPGANLRPPDGRETEGMQTSFRAEDSRLERGVHYYVSITGKHLPGVRCAADARKCVCDEWKG